MANKEKCNEVVLQINGEKESSHGSIISHEMISDNPTERNENQVSKKNTIAQEEKGLKWRKTKVPLLAKTTKLFSIPKEDEDDNMEEIAKSNTSKDKVKKKRSLLFFLQWGVFIALTTLMVVSLTSHSLRRHILWGLMIWKWCVMLMVVFCGRLASGWLVSLTMFIIERNFIFQERLLYFVHGVKNSVRNSIWLALVIASWFALFDPKWKTNSKSQKALDYVTRVLIAILVASIIWLVKIILLKILATNFHTNRFFDRIQDSYYNQYILQSLSPVMDVQSMDAEGENKAKRFNCFGGRGHVHTFGFEKIKDMKANNVSGWNMAILMKQISESQYITLSDAIEDSTDTDIANEEKARRVALKIFDNVAKPGAKFIYKDDLKKFLKEDDVEKVFPKFAGAAESKRIKRSCLKKWVINVFQDRHILACSLNDAETVVKQLDKIVSVVVTLIILVISAMIVGLATTRGILLITSQLVVVAFIFGNSCKTVFEAIIFVFVMHPFDVGDRCVVDGVQMIVQNISILTTNFLRYDSELICYPNSVLATKPISNFMRSPQMGDNIKFNISASTPIKKIEELRAGIRDYIGNKPHHWIPRHTLAVQEIENMNNMKMVLYITHTINYQDIVEKTNRRTGFVLELKTLLEKLGITYRLLPSDLNVNIIRQGRNDDAL